MRIIGSFGKLWLSSLRLDIVGRMKQCRLNIFETGRTPRCNIFGELSTPVSRVKIKSIPVNNFPLLAIPPLSRYYEPGCGSP